MKKQNWIGGLAAVSSDQDTTTIFEFCILIRPTFVWGKKEIKLSFFSFFRRLKIR